MRLEQMRDRMAAENPRGERLKIITADKDQPARKVSSWNPRWNKITAEKHYNQRKCLAVETPEERELRLEC